MRGIVNPLPGSVIKTPVFTKAAATWSTVASSWADLMTAAAPATCGVAIEVPPALAKPPPGTEE